MKKTCRSCGRKKDHSAFAKNSSKSDGLQTECRGCKSERDKKHYSKTWKAHKILVLAYKQKTREFIKSYLRDHPCVDCKKDDIDVLEFDHVRGNKSFTIAVATRRGMSIERVSEEIKKCDIRCANCHRKKTKRTLWT